MDAGRFTNMTTLKLQLSCKNCYVATISWCPWLNLSLGRNE
jgi:hypothetical protein